MRFDVFRLRTLTGDVLMSDRKSGFCLADHRGAAPGVWPGRHPAFLGDCEQCHPEATRVMMGTSRSYTDRYPAFFHGRDNDVASVRLRLAWRNRVPRVTVLRRCRAATC